MTEMGCKPRTQYAMQFSAEVNFWSLMEIHAGVQAKREKVR